MEDGRSYVGQHTVLYLSILVVRHVNEGHRVQRVSSVGRTVGVQSVVGITVVGDDDHLITVGLGSLNGILHAVVDGYNGLLDSLVDTRVAHHVAVGVVHHD